MAKMKNKNPITVIDLGSNTFRLVIYEQAIYPFPILYQKREFLKLGESINTGKLPSIKIKEAIKCLEEYIKIAKDYESLDIHIIATAAIRETTNGKEIIEPFKKIKSVRVELLSPKNEAKCGSLGVISSIKNPIGLVADLGGGSLELSSIKNKNILETKSLKIGILRSESDMYKTTKIKFDNFLFSKFKNQSLKFSKNVGNIYVIGGMWRNLAKLHLHLNGIKKNKLHGYLIPFSELEIFYHKLYTMDKKQIKKLNVVQPNRLDKLKLSTYILFSLASFYNIKNIIFVRYGIREGYLYDMLN